MSQTRAIAMDDGEIVYTKKIRRKRVVNGGGEKREGEAYPLTSTCR